MPGIIWPRRVPVGMLTRSAGSQAVSSYPGEAQSPQLSTGIVYLSVVFVVTANGAIGIYFPIGIAVDDLALAIGIFDNKIQTQFGIAEISDFVRLVILSHSIEWPIA